MMRILIGFVLMLVFLPVPAYAQDYYVDATNGDNSNNGTSPSSAWKTISKVNSMSFNPGDNIYFERGQTWREQLIVPSSGSAGNPITFASYGTGNKPKILRSVAKNSTEDWTGEGGNLWYTASGTQINNLVFDSEASEATMSINKGDLNAQGEGWWDSSNGRIYVYSTSNPATAYSGVVELVLKDYAVNVNDRAYIIIDGLDFRYVGNHAIYAVYSSAGSNLTVRNCNFNFIGDNLSGNTHFNGRSIILKDYDNTLIENNTFDYIWHCVDMFSPLEDGMNGFVVTIRNNKMGPHFHGYGDNTDAINFVFDRGDYSGSVISGNDISGFFDDAIDLRHASNVIVRNNILHDSAAGDGTGVGLGIKAGGTDDDGTSTGNQILRNKIYNINQGTTKQAINANGAKDITVAYNLIYNIGDRGINIANGVNGWEVYNNVIYGCGSWGIYVGKNTTSCTIRNNIFRNNTDDDIIVGRGTTVTGGFNCLEDASVGGPGTYNGSTDDLYSTNPLFVDAANADFTLQSDSPCIDAGTDVGLTLDFEGNPVSEGSAPDIGAYEYQSVVCGDGNCSYGENCSSCPGDCTCSSPISLYHFDEGLGITTADSSGNGNDGTIYGANWTTGILGKALEFDGMDDFVEVSNLSLDERSFTLEVWVKPNFNENDPSSNGAIGWYNGNDKIAIGHHDDINGWRFLLDNGGVWKAAQISATINSGTWYHLAGTFDSNTGTGELYVNGDPKDTETGVKDASTPSADLRIGEWWGSGNNWNGTIDEVGIYNRALTPEEISKHYNEAKADLNNDGFVDIIDLGIVANDFGKTSGYDPEADVVPNNEIDVFDLVFVASRFT